MPEAAVLRSVRVRPCEPTQKNVCELNGSRLQKDRRKPLFEREAHSGDHLLIARRYSMEPNISDAENAKDVLHNEDHSRLTQEEIAKAIAHHKKKHEAESEQKASPQKKQK